MKKLMKLNDVYYYRRTIPQDLREILGITEVRRSLRTTDIKDAKAIAKHMDQNFEKVFVAIMSGKSSVKILRSVGLKIRKRKKKITSVAKTLGAEKIEKITNKGGTFGAQQVLIEVQDIQAIIKKSPSENLQQNELSNKKQNKNIEVFLL